ncbi:MAG TPA: hypothetical protein VLS25_04175 [Dehalococcoidia bacterium]|nr:hypothetical protein [Dehalococcoidia bacterium]
MTWGTGYAGRMFRAPYDAKVNIELITTSEIRITCLIEEKQVPKAVRAQRPCGRCTRRLSWRAKDHRPSLCCLTSHDTRVLLGARCGARWARAQSQRGE